MKIGSATGSLAVLEHGRLVRDNVIAVNAALVRNPQPAVLSVYPGQIAEERRAVRVVGRPEIPPGIVCVGADFARALGIESRSTGDWDVTSEGIQYIPIKELSLELAVERPLEQAVVELNRSRDLYGALLLVNADEDIESLSMTIGEDVYRLRAVSPKPVAGTTAVLK